MNGRIAIATLIGSVFSFFLGWIVFGVLTRDLYGNNTIHYEGLMRGQDMNLVGIFLAQLCFCFMLAYVCSKWTNAYTFKSGARTGFVIMSLVSLGMNIYFLSTMNLYSGVLMGVDAVLSSVFYALVGGVIGAVLGYKRESAANVPA